MSPRWTHHILFIMLVQSLCYAHQAKSSYCAFSGHDCDGNVCIDHNDHCHQHQRHIPGKSVNFIYPEEMAEEEDLELDTLNFHQLPSCGTSPKLSKSRLWGSAMGCSLLVSLASLICLIIFPAVWFQGKPSKSLVDSLAGFGAGAMLGDAFLHQLPHAFGSRDPHSLGHHFHHHDHSQHIGDKHLHSHSIEDLAIGLSVLFGIVLFFLVEKVVRYIEDHSQGLSAFIDSHAHLLCKRDKVKSGRGNVGAVIGLHSDGKYECSQKNDIAQKEDIDKDNVIRAVHCDKDAVNISDKDKPASVDANSFSTKKAGSSETTYESRSSLIFGYLNLFSDGVHNFTDGMALGSAFLLHGSVGGWSRTLFLLAHELPQEVGDFGILVSSGFSVSRALFCNFLSALAAVAGTAVSLFLGKDTGKSFLIEGFTAGGFIYISVAGVIPEMNSGSRNVKDTILQLTSLILGMAVALCISFVE